MDARNIRGTVEEQFGRLILKVVVAVAAAVVALALSGALHGFGAAAQRADRADTIDALAAAFVVEPASVQEQISIRFTMSELQLFEEPALHHIVPSLGITQTQRDLWLLEEVNMQNLVVREPANTTTQTERDLWLLEEVNMHHLIPWDEPADDARPGDWIWNDLQLFEESRLHHLLPPGSSR